MNILHYSLGFPPYRTGGLTKFCMDLMKEQVREGNQVSLLWPGEIKLFGKHTKIKKNKSIDNIANFEVINPTPISYDEGIVDIQAFKVEGDLQVYERFLKNLCPKVIHIHTLMGLHKNFLIAAKKLGIKTVFTTHDFFPICPKVTMFRDGMICPDAETCESCPKCNMSALSIKKIQILQSPLYRELKNNPIVMKLRKSHRDGYLSEEKAIKEIPTRSSNDYSNLREFYKSLLDLVDIVHYNSSVSKEVYEKYMDKRRSVLISITHGNIQDHRKIKKFTEPLKITYLGPMGRAKGFFYLKEVLDTLWNENQNFKLNVFFHKEELPPYIIQHDRYNYTELGNIMDKTDILIAPSIWNETFGFTVLEALSYGVPVIVNSHVGAKDIIPADTGIVVHDSQELKSAIRNLTAKKLGEMNFAILNHFHVTTIDVFNRELFNNLY